MPMRLPVNCRVEYRGVQPAGEFTNDKGEVIGIPARPKFEYESSDGDVLLLPLSGSQLDKTDPPVDYAAFVKGDVFDLEGVVTLQDRGSGRESYFTVRSLVPVREGAVG